jgi:phosphohistidine phosphatase
MKAGRMGEFLAEMKFNPDLMVASPAARALSTATLVAERVGFSEHLMQTPEGLHNASPRTLLDIVCNLPESANRVMLIGHNPGISYLAEYFSGADVGYLSPGGMVCIGFDGQIWKELSQRSGRLLWQKSFDA